MRCYQSLQAVGSSAVSWMSVSSLHPANRLMEILGVQAVDEKRTAVALFRVEYVTSTGTVSTRLVFVIIAVMVPSLQGVDRVEELGIQISPCRIRVMYEEMLSDCFP